jgi:VanZ family protein
MSDHARSAIVLARYLALAWLGLVIYGSLHPFSGWRDSGISPLAFLEGGWPRYWTAFDLAVNVAVYLPFGFFFTLALSTQRWRWIGPVAAVLLAALTSFSLEIVQNWLPSRVPSNVDLACNMLGGLLGASAGQILGAHVLTRITRMQQHLIAPVSHAELGLTLLVLWLLVPLSPETLLFGAGDLRQILGLAGAVPFAADSFVKMEAGITALNTIAVGLIVRWLVVRTAWSYIVVPLFIFLGLLVRTLATSILVGPHEALSWLTPGSQSGLAWGLLVLLVSLPLPATPRLMLAALSLMAATVLVNLVPPNPYSPAALAAWRQGHFLNFNGLTRLVATLWPFLTLPFLFLTTRRR